MYCVIAVTMVTDRWPYGFVLTCKRLQIFVEHLLVGRCLEKGNVPEGEILMR